MCALGAVLSKGMWDVDCVSVLLASIETQDIDVYSGTFRLHTQHL